MALLIRQDLRIVIGLIWTDSFGPRLCDVAHKYTTNLLVKEQSVASLMKLLTYRCARASRSVLSLSYKTEPTLLNNQSLCVMSWETWRKYTPW